MLSSGKGGNETAGGIGLGVSFPSCSRTLLLPEKTGMPTLSLPGTESSAPDTLIDPWVSTTLFPRRREGRSERPTTQAPLDAAITRIRLSL